jgi:lipid A ethanolaminephosphotransferase
LSRRLAKWGFALLFLANGVAVYFISHYQVILDRTMMVNIFNTQFSESSELISVNLIVFWLFISVIPALILSRVKIKPLKRLKLGLHAVAIFLVSILSIYLAASSWVWIDKHAKRLGGMLLPWSYIINSARHYSASHKQFEKQTLLPDAQHSHNKKTVVVLVIGETARSQNFSLYGYPRATNPLLASLGVIALNDSNACATYTTAAIRCILSHDNKGSVFSSNFEPLPSYLNRHGVDVIWRSNNWGEPKIETQDFKNSKQLVKDCEGEQCQHDEVMLTKLKSRIQSSKMQKIFVVLHQNGSHGPAYHTRYPKEFEAFTPVCRSVELGQCSTQSLVNAYDNTILYTDHFLAQVIGLLKELNTTPSTMLYLSDHGESLGEHGLYLHGTPYTVAPDVQKKIPFILWMSDKFKQDRKPSISHPNQAQHHSQDNVFHSVLWALGINSPAYNSDLNIFTEARSK